MREEMGYVPDAGLLLGLGVIGLLILLMLNPRKVTEMMVGLLIVASPVLYNVYMPRSVMGVRGMSPANIMFALAFGLLLLRLIGTGRIFSFARVYLNLPLLIMIVLSVVGAGITYLSGSSHNFFQAENTRMDLILYELVRPFQVIAVGWLAMVVCFINGNKEFIQRVMLVAPIFLFAVTLFVALSVVGAGGLSEGFAEGRTALGWYLRLHGNQIGALGVYFLVLSLLMKEHGWPTLRLIAIACALGLVAISISRIALVSTALMLSLLIFKIDKSERRTVIIGLTVVVLLFGGDWALQLTNSGIDVTSLEGSVQNYDRISSGRIDGIWKPALAMIGEKLWFGHGLGTVVDTVEEGFIHPHNAYLWITLQMGLVGTFGLANLLFFAFKDAFRRKDELYYLLIAMCVISMTGHQFQPHRTNLVIWIVYGMALAERYAFARDEKHVRRPALIAGAQASA